MYNDEDFFLSLCAILRSMDVKEVGQKFIDAYVRFDVTEDEIDDRLNSLGKAFAIIGALGAASIPISFDVGVRNLIEEFSTMDAASRRRFSANVANDGADPTHSELVAAVRSCLTGDWGEPGDIDIVAA
jgi:hypothetical protein